MTTRYVGPGGSDANSGLTWALRKLTLAGVEATPVVAGDTVYVGPGTYREALTVSVSGTAGNPITYVGDYLGTNTSGVGGVVRITGSADDIAETRANWIIAVGKSYRTFQGFAFDLCSSQGCTIQTSTNFIFKQCVFANGGSFSLYFNGAQSTHLVDSCVFMNRGGQHGCNFTDTTTKRDNTGSIVQKCLFMGFGRGVSSTRIGGIAVNNCVFFGVTFGVRVDTALTAGQAVTVNNSIFEGCSSNGCQGTILGEVVEDYNTFYRNSVDRNTVDVGAHSLTYPPLFDARPWLQLALAGAGPNNMFQIASPFDLASYSALINVAGSSPTTTDLRGTAVQGANREWGALEYDSTLKIAGGIHKGRIRIGE